MEALVVSQILLVDRRRRPGGLMVLGLARQIGVLHERVAPLGALTTRTAVGVGDRAPEFDLVDLAARTIHIGGARRRAQPVAAVRLADLPDVQEAPARPARSRTASAAGLDVVLMGDGDRPSHEAMVAEHRLQDLPLVLAPIVGITLGIGKLPHAVLIDAAGVIRSSGIVNSREHLESLLVAQETGWASMQDYLLGTRRTAAVPTAAGTRG